MSTFGTAVVIDAPAGVVVTLTPELQDQLEAGFRTVAPDGAPRVSAYLNAGELTDDVLAMLRTLGDGRAAIAEDNDEYGARWVVATVVSGAVEIVHRRYVLNADPADAEAVEAAFADLGGDPRLDDVGTPEAAAAAFGVPAGPVVAAEVEAASAWEEIGVVGGPFPWWEALQLPWPVPAQGEPL